ncbi:MAG: toll/interleukin-1 receptor domain-containing protein [Candidatus Eremiobacteraeota bacterium]|nr:toll/interleukin-1 receptor domain-containing protein [Candidatus Eremiobacteraeota bacterium]
MVTKPSTALSTKFGGICGGRSALRPPRRGEIYGLGLRCWLKSNQQFQLFKCKVPHGQPKAFLCHSSLDKERIARPLDGLLRARGIEVWLDERDLVLGKNLVDEIFQHGISKSDAFIAILSKTSIDRPWVKEELSVAIVQRIAGLVKTIIPVVLDGVTPPAALAATVWETVPDPDDLDRHADRIATAIIGTTPVPVAPTPPYAGIPIHHLANLTADDERVFVLTCKQVLAHPRMYPIVSFDQLAQPSALGMNRDQIRESLTALEHAGYFTDVRNGIGQGPSAACISSWAFEQYLVKYQAKSYRQQKIEVIAGIVNQCMRSQWQLANQLGINEYIVAHILAELESGRHVRLREATTAHQLPTCLLFGVCSQSSTRIQPLNRLVVYALVNHRTELMKRLLHGINLMLIMPRD